MASVTRFSLVYRLISQMSPISYQSLNGAISASKRATEGLNKKGNHQNLTPKKLSKSNPVLL